MPTTWSHGRLPRLEVADAASCCVVAGVYRYQTVRCSSGTMLESRQCS
jgi:hypothetical protein